MTRSIARRIQQALDDIAAGGGGGGGGDFLSVGCTQNLTSDMLSITTDLAPSDTVLINSSVKLFGFTIQTNTGAIADFAILDGNTERVFLGDIPDVAFESYNWFPNYIQCETSLRFTFGHPDVARITVFYQ